MQEPQFSHLLEDIRNLTSQVGDKSNLILDMELDSYYVIDAVLLKLPEGADLLSQAQSLAWNPRPDQPPGPPKEVRSAVLAALLQADAEAAKGAGHRFS